MKNAIKEYIELNDEEKKELWKNAFFVFDTNIFIRLYSLTNEARDAFFKAIEKLKDRVWMPHQIAEEFMRNRVTIILDNQSKYAQIKKETDEHIIKLSKLFNISENDAECLKQKKQLNDWIDKFYENNLLVKQSSEDKILEKILTIFENKTGTAFTSEELKLIEKEGEIRYSKEIPPGYKDSSKKKNEDILNNMYGDFIIWKQILKFAKDNQQNIIYVTNDQKEDWWNIVKGQTIGPRVELRKEFISATNNKLFHMYTLDNFLKYSTEKIDDKILEEVKINPETPEIISTEDYDEDLINVRILSSRLSRLKHRAEILKDDYEHNERELDFIRHNPEYRNNDSDIRYYHRMMDKKEFLITKIIKLNEEIDRLTYEINRYRKNLNGE